MFLDLQSIMMPFVMSSPFHSHLFCPFSIDGKYVFVLTEQDRKKDLTAGKKKRENREEFAFTASLFKFTPPSPGRKRV